MFSILVIILFCIAFLIVTIINFSIMRRIGTIESRSDGFVIKFDNIKRSMETGNLDRQQWDLLQRDMKNQVIEAESSVNVLKKRFDKLEKFLEVKLNA